MTLDDFIKKYDGKYVDIDGMYGNQCKDLFSAYNTEVVGNPNYVWGNANQLWDNAPSEYYSKEQDPQRGDVVIWSTPPYGHVAIFIEKKAGGFTSFDQNYPIGSPCHYQGHTFNNIIGYLRPKGGSVSCKIDDEKALHLRRNVVYRFIKTYYNREASEKEIADHADWIERDSGDSFNYKGIGDWIANQVNEKEFKANWIAKKLADNATKVAQEKCDATIDKARADCQKEKDKLEKIIVDKNKSINELSSLLTTCQDEKKRLEILLGSTGEYTWVEHLALAIKKLFRKE